jgi:hypothetical protein
MFARREPQVAGALPTKLLSTDTSAFSGIAESATVPSAAFP